MKSTNHDICKKQKLTKGASLKIVRKRLWWFAAIGVLAAGVATVAFGLTPANGGLAGGTTVVVDNGPVGVLGIGSSGFLEATLTSINWTCDVSASPVSGCPAPWNGNVNSATTLTFAGGPLTLTEGVLINLGIPFGSPPPAGAGIFNPVMQFELHPSLLYFLTGVSAGSANHNCASLTTGQSCSIAGGSSLSYNATTDQYSYVWKTD